VVRISPRREGCLQARQLAGVLLGELELSHVDPVEELERGVGGQRIHPGPSRRLDRNRGGRRPGAGAATGVVVRKRLPTRRHRLRLGREGRWFEGWEFRLDRDRVGLDGRRVGLDWRRLGREGRWFEGWEFRLDRDRVGLGGRRVGLDEDRVGLDGRRVGLDGDRVGWMGAGSGWMGIGSDWIGIGSGSIDISSGATTSGSAADSPSPLPDVVPKEVLPNGSSANRAASPLSVDPKDGSP
jgi:hypothetical protein